MQSLKMNVFAAGSLAVLLLTAVVVPGAEAEKVTPVQKVIQMMEEMKVKGQREKEAEIKVMDEYTEWVDDTVRQLGFEIKTAKAAIEKLTAEIEKAIADIAALSEEIGVLDADIATWEGDQAAATAIRDKEHRGVRGGAEGPLGVRGRPR